MARRKKSKEPVSLAQTTGIVRRLVGENLKSRKRPLAAAIFCMVVVAGSTAGIAWLMRVMVNSIFVEGQQQSIWSIGGMVMTAFFAKGVASYFLATIMGSIGTGIVADLQKRQFDKLMTLDVAHYAGTHPAKYVARMLHSARAARATITLVMTNIFRDALTLAGLAAVMVFQDPIMSIAALIGAPIVVVAVMRIVRKTKEVAQSEEENAASVSASVTEAIQGVRVVKSFNLEPEMSARVSDGIDRMESRQNRLNKIISLTSPMMDIFAGLVIGAFIVYAGWQTLNYGKTPGEFMAFIAAFLLAYEPAKRLAGFQVQLQRQLVAVGRMYELLDSTDFEPAEPQRTLEFRPTLGHLKFEDVSFEYVSQSPVLHQVGFEARPGQRVALVGRSGAGKSTVFNLILGIYRRYEGSITIDGVEISAAALADLRSGIAYVSQDTFLFSGTVRENIRFGRRDATDEEILEAAAAANALGFIKALPDGFDTIIGNSEGVLSGGERQRIAIARALVKDAPLLLLDEATSALDGETERAVKNAESHLVQGRTTITIAHRLSTIQEADVIVVLDRGRVVGKGTHAELVTSNPVYQSLFSGGEFMPEGQKSGRKHNS
ncbi:MAG: ABC transporter ATP-binding protein [Hyphomicrobiales bacterium]|nr:ABC transporter ATP-binding protein [Hyphomicrobiales bacterium]